MSDFTTAEWTRVLDRRAVSRRGRSLAPKAVTLQRSTRGVLRVAGDVVGARRRVLPSSGVFVEPATRVLPVIHIDTVGFYFDGSSDSDFWVWPEIAEAMICEHDYGDDPWSGV